MALQALVLAAALASMRRAGRPGLARSRTLAALAPAPDPPPVPPVAVVAAVAGLAAPPPEAPVAESAAPPAAHRRNFSGRTSGIDDLD